MRTTDQKNLTNLLEETEHDLSWGPTEVPLTHKSYHEMADHPVVEMDVLSQIDANMALLEDLSGRLSFLMREVRYMMKA